MGFNIENKHEYHFLLLSFYQIQVFPLESRLITLGRDPSRDLAIECNAVSREHATFLRVPGLDPGKYEYRIIDGGPSKNRSKNGISINGKTAYMHRLDHGDLIQFGPSVNGLYLKVELESADLKTYINILRRVEDLEERTRSKIILMTRVFDKVTSYLAGEEDTVTITPLL